MEKFLKDQERYQKDQEEQREAIKNLTSQVGQLYAHNKMLKNQITAQASGTKQGGIFPSQPQNLREQAKMVTLRSGKQLSAYETKNNDVETACDLEKEKTT